MAKFTVRVVLQGASWEDYEDLHEAMEQLGFLRYLIGKNDNKVQLPDAEYNYDGVIDDMHEVLRRAKRAAGRVGKESSILVTKAAGRTWSNLDPY
ncbi:hypothetical protein [Modicisalibacter sp. MOD 31.J]|uniref:hypothetical protein n=1 Tax=Modicisalibacter sp. MOD 31.J TaxID=2831897 RepID=UPI001CC947A4|nr:hypothetical protein [Modicisalibacter sp. MOD 31.J]MBZ9574379.1 hypothetical protein [Modicisalibacter sp. MOD 31.J]